ncbi:GLYCOSYL TRANSFERASE [hydrothermal vent metagenome]|uniref:GLYCOSYL TRANSFERASE n=1 Tax=hydrothermal vent metagenome TaxID=652676 RepID=A0A3B1B6H1_9ZZZZ
MPDSIIAAFGSVPKDGGTFTFYRNIRPALLEHGIDMRCVAIGKAQAELWEEAYVDDGCVLLAPDTRNIKKQAIVFAEWCDKEKVDIVMGINSEAILSSLPHLPEKIKAMSRCANAFDHGYKITLSCAERLARIVAITPRLKSDLIEKYGADPSKLSLIPNGIDQAPFEQAAKAKRGQELSLQLGFLGRLEHNQKGVLYLPEIVQELNRLGVQFKLRIAGKGKHQTQLELNLKTEIEKKQVELVGALTPDSVPAFLSETDLFLFTSHFEGCPNALLEAIMAGCVPVSWLIDGITDFIIEDDKSGFICPMEDVKFFARRIKELDKDREKLQAMSEATAQVGRARFTHECAAMAYASLFKEVMVELPPLWVPKPWKEFRQDPNFEHSWTELLPANIKNWLKQFTAAM